MSRAGSGFDRLKEQSNGFAQTVKSHEQGILSWGRALTGAGAIVTGSFVAPILAGTKAAWGQVDAVEQATVAFRAYEKDAGKVDQVLSGLLKYARSDLGVLFQRQELFGAAQGLKVMGAETENIVDYVEIMSRSVGLGTGTWTELERVIGRVGSTGRLTGDDFDMLTKMGYRLDTSLRNTDISWEQLFTNLDKGIPADALAGQADTIQGRMIRLQSALRGLGIAFLGVDADTSQFIKGGLGDTLRNGLTQAREVLLAMVPTVQMFGNAVAAAARIGARMLDFFIGLPQPIQTAIFAFTALGGALTLASGIFLLMLPRIANIMIALGKLGGVSGAIGRVATAVRALSAALLFNPAVLLATAAALGVVVAYKKNFLGFGDAVRSAFSKIVDVVDDVIDTFDDAIDAFTDVWDAADDVTVMFGEFALVIDSVGKKVNTVSRFLYSLGAALSAIGLDRIAGWVNTAAGAIDELTQRFQGLRALGLDPVSAALVAIGTTFETLAPLMNDLAGIVSNVTDAFGAFVAGDYAAGFDALGEAARGAWDALREIGDMTLDVVVSIGSWIIEQAGDLSTDIQNWLRLNSANIIGNIAGIVVNVAGWVKGAVEDIWGAIKGWVFGDGNQGDGTGGATNAGVGGRSFDIAGIAVNVIQWARGKIDDLWTAIKGFVVGGTGSVEHIDGQAIGGPNAGAITVSDVAVNISNWVKGAFPDLWGAIKSWVYGATGGSGGGIAGGGAALGNAAGGGVSLQSVLVNILSWARGEAANIWEFVSSWIDGLVAVASGAAADIASVAVNILSWARGEIADLWGAIKSWVFGGGVAGGGSALGAAATGQGIDIERVLVRIGEFKIANDVGDLISGINTWIDNAVTVTDADAAAWEPKGRAIGQKVMAAIITGIQNIFSGGGGGGIAGGGAATGGIAAGGSFGDGIWRYLQPMFEGAWEELKPELDAWAESTKRSIEGWWNSIAPSFLEFDRSYTLAGGGAALGGAAGGGGGMLQGVVDAFIDGGTALLADLAEWGSDVIADIQEWWDGLWDFDLSLPDFDILGFLPDIGFDVEDIPGYGRAKAAIDAFKDLLDFGGDKYGEDGPGGGIGGPGGNMHRSGFESAGPGGGGRGSGAGRGAKGESFGGGSGQFAGMLAEIQSVTTALTTMGQRVATTTVAFSGFYSAMTPIVSGLITLGLTFTQLYTVLTTVVSGLITTGSTFTQLYTVLTTVVSGLITLGLTFTQLYLVLTTTVSGLITLGLTFTQLYTVLTTTVSGLITLGLTFTQLYLTMPPVVSGLITLGLTFTQFYTVLTTVVSGLITTGSTFTQLGTVITTFGLTVSTTMATFGTAMAGGGRDVQKFASEVSMQMGAVSRSVSSGMREASSAVSTEAGSWPGLVSAVEGRMRSAGVGVGAAASSGVADGILSVMWRVTAAANMIVNEVERAMNAKARIASPSKMTMRIGEYMGEGFAIGIDHMQREVARSAAALVSIPSGSAAITAPAYAVNSSLSRRQDRAAAAAPPSGGNVTNYYLVVTKEEIDDLFDAATGFKVLTSPAEVAAAQGRI